MRAALTLVALLLLPPPALPDDKPTEQASKVTSAVDKHTDRNGAAAAEKGVTTDTPKTDTSTADGGKGATTNTSQTDGDKMVTTATTQKVLSTTDGDRRVNITTSPTEPSTSSDRGITTTTSHKGLSISVGDKEVATATPQNKQLTVASSSSPGVADGANETRGAYENTRSQLTTIANTEATNSQSVVTIVPVTPDGGSQVPSGNLPAPTFVTTIQNPPQSTLSGGTPKTQSLEITSGVAPEAHPAMTPVPSTSPEANTSQSSPAAPTPTLGLRGKTEPTQSKGPALPGTTASPGPTVTLSFQGSPSSSLKPTQTDAQGSYTWSPTSTLGNSQVKCEPPERPDEKMLVLNLTKTSLCAPSPLDEKLVHILCKTAKASFNPEQDQCHIRLAPVPDGQGVVVKEISIQTNLLPNDIYELLKDKWDDLKEAGVSNMQLGDQGPPEEAEDRFSMPLIITIVCMASFLLLVAALYGCCHQRLSHRKDQQRLTEELQTVENGYHDNPTLEVMETSSEMQEKKMVNLNGELGDSWIVPLDNLTKDDLDEEEDTHL